MIPLALLSLALHIPGLAAQVEGSSPISFTSNGNPIWSNSSWYSADPAPLVVNDTLYIITGRDTAPPNQNAFDINQWGMFESSSPDPKGSDWTLHPNIGVPESIFSWAKPGSAYAAQVVQGADGRFYLYAPVTEADSSNEDPFAIGVAVADTPTGPYKDAHPDGPIISQSVPSPGNSIQNIDPTVFVDDDGQVYIYFGTFGALLGYKLDKDMITIKGDVTRVTSLTGYFEAPWLMKRKDTYYMLFAANNAGEDSPCTPTSYHACLAYGTASSPLGPWTFQDVILPIVSSTTSHPGAVELNGEWYLVYHTADAEGGGHFRRSVAFDKLTWDDSASPAKINTVVQTFGPKEGPSATYNAALKAVASSKNGTPIQYWVKALNDGIVRETPLPPDYWCSYDGTDSPGTSTLVYTWNETVTLNGTSMVFFADQPAGADEGVAPPKAWHVEYKNGEGEWVKATTKSEYPLKVTDSPDVVGFEEFETKSIRAILTASGSEGQYAGVGVKEWEALSTTLQDS
ncbi:Arabinanase/levansucrase/invertase [Aspergillus steynii IBT 23096]|uniref:Arabinanase/levansucrase/invertase n=1 Tax=Aspergillus steynii IBT 23096 TaxID=1392250 RepID=A0A2I2G6G9_9EURO|nr:Arabinanase/levansucrase/invertase [Aspergillus steynii IBT 23096]PLB48477.1 Arabinanase/levansucrase/invertase [Aspergillus steynii IBT 23096]